MRTKQEHRVKSPAQGRFYAGPLAARPRGDGRGKIAIGVIEGSIRRIVGTQAAPAQSPIYARAQGARPSGVAE
jgi:hypothetical protein